jgi:argininosuccinate lyase
VTRLVFLLQEVKLWGGRFEKPVTEAVTKFSESVSYDKRLYSQDLKGSRAHCKMLAAQVSGTVR